MTVIAMTREMGSLGKDVALSLAKDLGLRLVQHELVGHLAEKMHVRESSVNRFLEGKASLFERWGIDEQELSLYTTEEILDVAAEGNVLIRGWGRPTSCGEFSMLRASAYADQKNSGRGISCSESVSRMKISLCARSARVIQLTRASCRTFSMPITVTR